MQTFGLFVCGGIYNAETRHNIPVHVQMSGGCIGNFECTVVRELYVVGLAGLLFSLLLFREMGVRSLLHMMLEQQRSN